MLGTALVHRQRVAKSRNLDEQALATPIKPASDLSNKHWGSWLATWYLSK
jgi:hypothetical protein